MPTLSHYCRTAALVLPVQTSAAELLAADLREFGVVAFVLQFHNHRPGRGDRGAGGKVDTIGTAGAMNPWTNDTTLVDGEQIAADFTGYNYGNGSTGSPRGSRRGADQANSPRMSNAPILGGMYAELDLEAMELTPVHTSHRPVGEQGGAIDRTAASIYEEFATGTIDPDGTEHPVTASGTDLPLDSIEDLERVTILGVFPWDGLAASGNLSVDPLNPNSYGWGSSGDVTDPNFNVVRDTLPWGKYHHHQRGEHRGRTSLTVAAVGADQRFGLMYTPRRLPAVPLTIWQNALQVTGDELVAHASDGAAVAPGSATWNIANADDLPLDWTATVSFQDETGGWLQLSAAGGTLAGGGDTDLTATIDISGLAAGQYLATVTISATVDPTSDPSPDVTRRVLLVIAAGERNVLIERVRTALAGMSAFQAWCGLEDGDEVGARLRTWRFTSPDEEAGLVRPCVLVFDPAGPGERTDRLARDTFWTAHTLHLDFRLDLSGAARTSGLAASSMLTQAADTVRGLVKALSGSQVDGVVLEHAGLPGGVVPSIQPRGQTASAEEFVECCLGVEVAFE